MDVPEPRPAHPLAGDGRVVVIDVEAAGVSFPEVLQTRGAYQIKPELPFVPGSRGRGTVRARPRAAGLKAGDRVAAFPMLGGFAEVALAPHFDLPAVRRARLRPGRRADPQLPHGLLLAGHARPARRRARPCSSTARRAASARRRCRSPRASARARSRSSPPTRRSEVARAAGADEVVRADGVEGRGEGSGGGADLVVDPVGGDRFTDRLRSLQEEGRLLVVGFTGGSIPEVKVNRLLLNNVVVVGAGWGAYVITKPAVIAEIQARLDELIAAGHVRRSSGRACRSSARPRRCS